MKKWTYLVAAGMMLGATPVFTGCIDNDEPEGISILRGAKAELLKAKAAVEAAKTEQVKAEAAYLLAQAEYQKALAATENANAKIKEAIAKQEEAKAKLIETQNEVEKQKLQAEIAALEHQKEMWEIEKQNAITSAEQAVKMWELAYKQAELAYEQALLDLASKKAALTQQQQLLLADYVAEVKTAKKALADKKEAVRKAQRTVNKAAQVVEETEADKEYFQFELARTLRQETKALEGYEAALEEAKVELGEFETMKPTELSAKLDALKQELKDLRKKIADESVKAAEERRAIQEGEQAELIKKMQAMNESLYNDEIEIPAFTYPEVVGMALPPIGWTALKDVEYEALTYTWQNQSNYNYRLGVLKNLLAEFQSWTRDENDNEWTAQRIAELKKDIEDANAEVKTLKEEWKEAVDAYHRTPADINIDLSKITGYSEAVAAITDFNTAVEELNKAWEDFDKACNDYYNTVNYEFRTNKDNIWREYNAEHDRLDPWNKASEMATAEQNRLEEVYEALKKDPNADEDALQEALDAKVNFNWWEFRNNSYAELVKPLEETRDAALKAEDDKRIAAETALRTANEVYKAKKTALDTQVGVAQPLYNAFVSKASVLIEEYSYIKQFVEDVYFYDNAGMGYGTGDLLIEPWTDEEGNCYASEYIFYPYYAYPSAVDTDVVTEITRDEIRELIAYRSKALFGNAYGLGSNDYGDPDSRLLDLTFDDVKKMIEDSSEEPLFGYDYLAECAKYGKMGRVFILEAQLEFAEAWLKDENSSVNKLISATEEAIEAMTAKNEEIGKGYEEQIEAMEAEQLAINKKLLAAVEALEDLRQTKTPIIQLKKAVKQALEDYKAAGFEEWSQDAIDKQIAKLKAQIESLEYTIETQKHAIETAQRNLDAYNNGNLNALQIAKEALEDAEAEMAAAQEVYNDALEALNKMIAALAAESAE